MDANFPYPTGYVGQLTSYSPSIASDLDELMRQLGPERPRGHSDEDAWVWVTQHGGFFQFVAVETLGGTAPRIVATANLSLVRHRYDDTMHPVDMPAYWLGSFVVHEQYRGKGTAVRLWESMRKFMIRTGATTLQFTSRPHRTAAHAFYDRMGARKIGTVRVAMYDAENPSVSSLKNTLRFDAVYEQMAGHLTLVFGARGDPDMASECIDHVAGMTATRRVEHIRPCDPSEYTTVMFSVDVSR